jgi:hypothetical protein
MGSDTELWAQVFASHGILSAMTDPRKPSHPSYPAPDQVPQAPRRRPSDERAALASSTRTATQLAVLAIVIAGIALGITVLRVIAPVAASCQNAVWSAQPAANELPDQWTVKGTTFDTNRRTTQFSGVDAGDGSGAPNVLATVTCFPDGAADAVSRAQAAARETGQVVNARTDLSDGGFEATDASGAIFLEFRRGDIVVDLAASGGATATDIETVASAFDKALGGDGGSIATPEPSQSGDVGSPGPSASGDTSSGLTHDAPELEKLLPTAIGGVPLTIDSALGSTVLTSDAGGRAATAALKAKGKVPDDLRYAEALDQTQTVAVSALAISVKGLSAADTQTMLLDWFQLSGAGVTHTDVKLSGKAWTRYDLGDEGPANYFRTDGTAVLVITTSDPALAEEAAAAMP